MAYFNPLSYGPNPYDDPIMLEVKDFFSDRISSSVSSNDALTRKIQDQGGMQRIFPHFNSPIKDVEKSLQKLSIELNTSVELRKRKIIEISKNPENLKKALEWMQFEKQILSASILQTNYELRMCELLDADRQDHQTKGDTPDGFAFALKYYSRVSPTLTIFKFCGDEQDVPALERLSKEGSIEVSRLATAGLRIIEKRTLENKIKVVARKVDAYNKEAQKHIKTPLDKDIFSTTVPASHLLLNLITSKLIELYEKVINLSVEENLKFICGDNSLNYRDIVHFRAKRTIHEIIQKAEQANALLFDQLLKDLKKMGPKKDRAAYLREYVSPFIRKMEPEVAQASKPAHGPQKLEAASSKKQAVKIDSIPAGINNGPISILPPPSAAKPPMEKEPEAVQAPKPDAASASRKKKWKNKKSAPKDSNLAEVPEQVILQQQVRVDQVQLVQQQADIKQRADFPLQPGLAPAGRFQIKFHPRVVQWFKLPIGCKEIPFKKYSVEGVLVAGKLRLWHAFSTKIDSLLKEPEYAFYQQVDVKGAKRDVYHLLAHMEYKNEKDSEVGVISYVFINDAVCIHRYFSKYSSSELINRERERIYQQIMEKMQKDSDDPLPLDGGDPKSQEDSAPNDPSPIMIDPLLGYRRFEDKTGTIITIFKHHQTNK